MRWVARFALGTGGWAFAVLIRIVGFQDGRFVLPGGEVRVFHAFVGDAFRSGADPCAINADGTASLHAAPWGPRSRTLVGGPAAVHAVILVGTCLRSAPWPRGWVGAGMFCRWVLVPWEMAAGQIELIMAASVVAAVGPTAWPAVVRTDRAARLPRPAPAFALT